MARPIVEIAAHKGILKLVFITVPPEHVDTSYCEVYADVALLALAFRFTRHKTEAARGIRSSNRRTINIPLYLLSNQYATLVGRHALSYDAKTDQWLLKSVDCTAIYHWKPVVLPKGRPPVMEAKVVLVPVKRAAFFNMFALRTIVGNSSHCSILTDPEHPERVGFRFLRTAEPGAKPFGSSAKRIVTIGVDIWSNPVFRCLGEECVSLPLHHDEGSDVWFVDLRERVQKKATRKK